VSNRRWCTLAVVVGMGLAAAPASAGTERLAFQSDRGPTEVPFTQLYTVSPRGGDVQPLITDFPREFPNSFDPAWSPDGRDLAFTSLLGSHYFEVFVARADGTSIRRVSRDPRDHHDSSPAWFPNGRALAYVSNRSGTFQLWRLELRPPFPAHQLTHNGANNCGCYGPFNTFSAPSISPDGRHIAFTSDLAAPGRNLDIFVMRSDGSHVVRLTDSPAIDAEADWSPDGREIAFNSDRDGDQEIYVIGSNGGPVRQLTHNTAVDRQPDWSPDGRRIAFDSDRSGAFDIWVMNADGSGARNVTHDAAFDERPAWRP
jgi:TolB protein